MEETRKYKAYREVREMRKQTPWGTAQNIIELAPGIISYSTASHGGIWLSIERRAKLPPVKNFLGGDEWWEEDCDWAVPYFFFAEDIKAFGKAYHFDENLEVAKRIIANFHKELAI